MFSEVPYPEFPFLFIPSVVLSEVVNETSVPKSWLQIAFGQRASLEANSFILVSL